MIPRDVSREIAQFEMQGASAWAVRYGWGIQFDPETGQNQLGEGIIVQVELAGVQPEDLRLIVDGEYLQITGTREPPHPESPERYLQMEISRGRFERVLRVGVPYDPDRIRASVDAGILTIVLPRKARVVRKIEVTGS